MVCGGASPAEQGHELVHGQAVEFLRGGEELHDLVGLGLAVVRAESGDDFFAEDRDAVGAAAAVADGEVDFDFFRLRAVGEEDLDGVGDGAEVRVEVVGGILAILPDLHLGAQRVDPGICRDAILIVGGGQPAEDQTDGGHVLEAVVAVRRVVQRPALVDDADRRFVRGEFNPLDLVQPVFDRRMQLQRTLHRRLGMELRREGDLEEDVLHDVAAERTAELDRLALERDVLKSPGGGAQGGRVAHLAGHRNEGEPHRAARGVARRPRLA